jgi:hypothetical protein
MKKFLFLIVSLLLLSQETALSQGNSGKIKDKGKDKVKNKDEDTDPAGPSSETGPILLPVTLSRFEVSADKGLVKLAWTTATEKDNAYFQVECSRDGLSFSAIGQVSGNGTTQQVHQYRFQDVKPVTGTLYYRLKQVDLNGDSELSPVKAVKALVPIVQKLPVYPNPVVADLNIALNTLPAGTYSLTVAAINSGLVKQKTVQGGEWVMLNLQEMPAGVYILTITGENFKQTNKFIKS